MTLLSEYLAELQKRIERERDALARGSARTVDEYTKACGVIRGLEMAGSLLKDLVERKPIEERD